MAYYESLECSIILSNATAFPISTWGTPSPKNGHGHDDAEQPPPATAEDLAAQPASQLFRHMRKIYDTNMANGVQHGRGTDGYGANGARQGQQGALQGPLFPAVIGFRVKEGAGGPTKWSRRTEQGVKIKGQ